MDTTETTHSSEPHATDANATTARERLRVLRAVARSLTLRLTNETRLGLYASLAIVAVVRIVELRMPKNPDGFHKWDIARDWLAGQAFKASHFDHHAARWAVNLPIAAAQSLFGTSASVAYWPIIVFDVLQGLVTYLLGKAIGSPAVGVWAVVLFSVVPQMCYVGSELLPTIFESTYVLAACYALVRLVKGGGQRWLYISLAFSCAAYMAKETTVFFFPGMLLGLYLARRRLSECALYTLGFITFVGIETLLYRLTLGFRMGRLSIIAGHHLGNPRLQRPIDSFWDLFQRYLELSNGFEMLFYVALLASVTYPWWRNWGRRAATTSPTRPFGELHRASFLIVLLGCWSYFFCSTFALKSLHPPQLAQPANERYLFSAIPLLALIVTAFAAQLLRIPLSRLRRPMQWVLAAAVAVAFLGSSLLQRGHRWSQSPLHLTPQYEAALHDAFDKGIPIVARNDGANAMTAVSTLFLDRARSKHLRCERFKSKGHGTTRVCVNWGANNYRGKSSKALRRALSKWSQAAHVDVSTTRGFSATLRQGRAT